MEDDDAVPGKTPTIIRYEAHGDDREQTFATLFRRAGQRTRRAGFKRYYCSLLLACLLALIVRLLHVTALTYSPFSDMQEYLRYMRALFQRESFHPASTLLFPPGYPLFLHLISRLAKLTTIQPVLITQAFLDSLSVLALASLARFCYGARVAVLSAFGYAFYRISILFTGVVLPESICIDLMLWTMAAFIWQLRRPSLLRAVLTAVLFATSVHVRANMVVLLPVLAGFLVLYRFHTRWQASRAFRYWLAEALLLVFVGCALLAPWSLRNTLIAGRFSFVSDNVGHNLVQGNNYVSNGSFTPPELMPDRVAGRLRSASGPQLHEEMKRFGIDYILNHPAQFAFYLLPNKVGYLLWEDQVFWPWEQEVAGGHYGDLLFGPFVRIPLLPYTPVLVLAGVGLMLRGRKT